MTAQPRYPADIIARAHALHDRIITFDSHVDLPLNFGRGDLAADLDGPTQFDLAKAARGRLSGAALTVHASAARPTAENAEKGRAELEARHAIIAGIARDFPDRAGIAHSPDEFRKLAKAGRFAIVIGFQNAAPLGDDLAKLDDWISRGVRQFAFTFIGNNIWADSSRPYPYIGGKLRSNGLSDLGKRAVGRLNELGAMIDVSQLSSAALGDVLAIARAPVIASHSAVRGLVDVDRNLSDAELLAIKRGGGVVQIAAFGLYLEPLDDDMLGRLRSHWARYGLPSPRTLAAALTVNEIETEEWADEIFWTFLHEFHDILRLDRPTAGLRHFGDAIDYAVERIGIDHVGIASDFNHGGGVLGWTDAAETVNVTAELIARGYSDGDIAKLWGENFLRVWQDVENVARGRAPAAGGEGRSRPRRAPS